MEASEYQQKAERAMRSNDGYYHELILEWSKNGNLEENLMLLNAQAGLSGEAGEFADAVKKALFHKKELDIHHLVLELGDIAFYIVMACKALGVSFDSVLEANNRKLSERFPNGFTPEDAALKRDVREVA